MSEEKVLTKEIAEQFLADEYSVALGDFNKIQDAAAECLSKYQGTELYLEGLAELSDAAAESLGKLQGEYLVLNLSGLTQLSNAAAESLSKYKGRTLDLYGLA